MPQSIGDFIKSLLGIQPQPLASNQAGLPAPYQPAGGGSLMEALGVPLALFGAYEAARGRPIGAPASLAGAGLSYLGNQRNANATAYNAFEAALQAAQKRAPVGSGVQEQLKALEPVGQADPTEGINETKEVLKQYFEQNKAQKKEVREIGPDKIPYLFDPAAGTLTKIPNIPTTTTGTTPKGLFEHPMEAKAFEMGFDPNNMTPAQVKDVRNALRAEDLGKTEEHARIAAKYGLASVVNPDGSMGFTNRIGAVGKTSKAAPIKTIPGYVGAHSTDIPGASVYRPAPTTGLKATVGAKAAKLLGGGKSFMILPDGRKVMDGDVIPGTGIRWRAD